MNIKLKDFIKVKNIETPILVKTIYIDIKGTVYNYQAEYRNNDLGSKYQNIRLEDVEYVVEWRKSEQ